MLDWACAIHSPVPDFIGDWKFDPSTYQATFRFSFPPATFSLFFGHFESHIKPAVLQAVPGVGVFFLVE